MADERKKKEMRSGNRALGLGGNARLLRRLSYSKYLYDVARRGLCSPSPLAGVMALLQMHDSVEIFQVVVLESVRAPINHRRPFMEFWDRVKDKTGAEPPYRHLFDVFNNMRVQLKHHAIVPDLTELRGLCAVIPSFFSEVSAKFLNIDFSTISLADLLENREARDRMKEAEQAMLSADYQTALGKIAVAFEILMQGSDNEFDRYVSFGPKLSWERPFKGSDIQSITKNLRPSDSGEVRAICERFQMQLDELKRTVELLVCGVNLQQYKKFRYVTPLVSRASSGFVQLIVQQTHPILVNEENTNFGFQFVLETGLRTQEQRVHVLNPRALHKLKTIESPTRLYRPGADESLSVVAEIPKDFELEGRPSTIPSLGDAWEVTYNGSEGFIRFPEATIIESDT